MVSLFDLACLWLGIGLPIAVGYFVGRTFGFWSGIISGLLLLLPCVVVAIRLHQAPRMKMKWRWLALLGVPSLVFAVIILMFAGRSAPVEVICDLRGDDVEGIMSAVKREMRKDIWPDFSLSSVKNLPSAIRRYKSFCSSIRFFTVDLTTENEAFVFAWTNTNGISTVPPKGSYVADGGNVHIKVDFAEFVTTNGYWFAVTKDSNGWSRAQRVTYQF